MKYKTNAVKKMTDGFRIGGDRLAIYVLVTLLSFLVTIIIGIGSFYLAEYVVGRKHRADVLEDSYKEAVDHIASLEREIIGLNQQIEQMNYDAQRAGERLDNPRRWNPADPLNTQPRQ